MVCDALSPDADVVRLVRREPENTVFVLSYKATSIVSEAGNVPTTNTPSKHQ